MINFFRKKTAFFSLNRKIYAVKFAKFLKERDWCIVATDETYRILKNNNIVSVRLNEYVNLKKKFKFPPTLHPELEHSLVDKKKKIDLVYVVPYPISKGFDIGGHTIISLAIKGQRIVISNNKDLFMYMLNVKKFGKLKKKIFQKLLENSKKKVIKFYATIFR